MKHGNTLFLALTALLTMSFAFGNNHHWFGPPATSKRASIPNCYTPVIRILTSTCAGATITCNRSDIGAPVLSKSGFSDPTICELTGSTFCCAQLTTGTQACPGQLFSNSITEASGNIVSGYVFVADVYCKEP